MLFSSCEEGKMKEMKSNIFERDQIHNGNRLPVIECMIHQTQSDGNVLLKMAKRQRCKKVPSN